MMGSGRGSGSGRRARKWCGHRLRGGIVCFFWLVLVGCADRGLDERSLSGDSNLPAPTPSGPGDAPGAVTGGEADSAHASEVWTAGIVRSDAAVREVATLVGARTARNEGFDRLVLEFSGEQLPGYAIEYVDRPVRQCGSGEPVPLLGDAWLLIQLEPAYAHDDEGHATIENRAFRPNHPMILEARLICDFEAHVNWALGMAAPNQFRVLELKEPTRLVVDIRH